jgi:hypothetical protein
MRWTVVVPGALLPAPIAADVLGAARAPRLARLLSRAQVDAPLPASAPTAGAAHWGWLWRRFSGRRDAPVTAPYAWRALDSAASPGASDAAPLWQLDPLHFALALDHMLAVPLDGADALDLGETMALAAAADACAQRLGARVRVLDRHWFLAPERPWSLQAVPLEAALSESIQPLLPAGPDAAHWRRLLNEIQIAWHHEPISTAREARGAKAVNGLWLHGGGVHAALPASGLAWVASEAPAVRGWALAAGVPAASVNAGDGEIDHRGDGLATWWPLFVAAKAEAWHPWITAFAAFDRWFGAVAEQAFAAGAEVELVLCGRSATRTARLACYDRWRLWRRVGLAAVLSEPVEAA